MGLDRDYQAFQTATRSRLGRTGFAFKFFGGKVAKSWWRIIKRGSAVELPVWQRPAAMVVTLGFYGIGLAGELKSALTRDFEPLPQTRRSTAEAHAAASAPVAG
jgi:hypothetical protein